LGGGIFQQPPFLEHPLQRVLFKKSRLGRFGSAGFEFVLYKSTTIEGEKMGTKCSGDQMSCPGSIKCHRFVSIQAESGSAAWRRQKETGGDGEEVVEGGGLSSLKITRSNK